MGLTIHHLNSSQSERIVFLCEELGVPYELKLYKRNPIVAPPELARLHPTKSAPVIEDEHLKAPLAESAAIMVYICQIYGEGRLMHSPQHPAYADFLYWFHWANCSMQPVLSIGMAQLAVRGTEGQDGYINQLFNERRDWALDMLEARVAGNEWLAGDEFTAADVMLVYTFTTYRTMYPLDLSRFPAIVAWLDRVCTRDGYKRAMQKCDPDIGYTRGAAAPPRFNSEYKGAVKGV